jgi:hypothetical protein
MQRKHNMRTKLIESHIENLKWRLGQILPSYRYYLMRRSQIQKVSSSFNRYSGALNKKKLIELLIQELERRACAISLDYTPVIVHGHKFATA